MVLLLSLSLCGVAVMSGGVVGVGVGDVGEDAEGEVIIFTGLVSDENQELREMTHEDIE